MKFDKATFVNEVEFLDQAISDKYRACGTTFAEKVASLQGKAPQLVVDDLTSVAQLYERVKNNESVTDEELTQISVKIDAVYPAVAMRKHGANWIVWVVLIAAAVYACWRFLPR